MALRHEIDELLSACEAEGATIHRRKRHVIVEKDGNYTTVGLTPSDNRAIANDKANLRRLLGLSLRPEHEIRRKEKRELARTGVKRPVERALPDMQGQAGAVLPRRDRTVPRYQPRNIDGERNVPLFSPGVVIIAPNGRPKSVLESPQAVRSIEWTIHDAVSIVEQGYTYHHAKKLTGFSMAAIRRAMQ